jgi:hypothetical protein
MKHMQEFKLFHPIGIEISSELKEADVSVLPEVSKRDMKNGYVWYRFLPVTISGEVIAISLCFFNGTLKELSLGLANPDLYGGGWNDWSEEKEKARARDTEKWLNSLGFNAGKYYWGEIWANYDAKGASGSAGVRFAL